MCIKIFKNFKETRTFKPPFAADALLGGALLCVRAGEVCFFFDWAECRLVRRIDVQPKSIKWSETGELVVLVCEESFFVLRYNRDTVNAAFEAGGAIGEDDGFVGAAPRVGLQLQQHEPAQRPQQLPLPAEAQLLPPSHSLSFAQDPYKKIYTCSPSFLPGSCRPGPPTLLIRGIYT